MQPIGIDDPRWLITVPQLVSPRPDEWLPGVLLRCDAANGWASRTTLAHLLRVGKKKLQESWRSDIPNLIVLVPNAVNLHDLAHLLAISPTQLRGTTYTDELARIFGLPKLHPTLLTMAFSFQLCPACIAEERMLRRLLVLPYLSVCPRHQIALQSTCRCGAALAIFKKHTAPFCCHQCGGDWGNLPRQVVTAEQHALAQHLVAWYEFFLTTGTPTLVKRALHLIEQRPVRNQELPCEASHVNREVRRRSAYRRRLLPLPLGKLVASLVERDLVLDNSIRDYLSTGA
jgi:hypothetical protein